MDDSKEFLTLVILTVLVILIWIASDIYRTRTNVELTPNLQKVLEPLNPDFDKQTLDFLKRAEQP